MSEQSMGPGYWQASDGLWYPPESAAATSDVPNETATDSNFGAPKLDQLGQPQSTFGSPQLGAQQPNAQPQNSGHVAPTPAPAPAPATKNNTNKIIVGVLLGVLLLVGGCIVGVATFTRSARDTLSTAVEEGGFTVESSNSGPATTVTGGIGDKLSADNIDVIAHSVGDLQPEDDFSVPDDGNKWIVIDMEFTNTGTEEDQVNAFFCVKLFGSDNREYKQALGAPTENEEPNTTLLPGKTVRGDIAYEVPLDASGLRLDVTCEGFPQTIAEINLQ